MGVTCENISVQSTPTLRETKCWRRSTDGVASWMYTKALEIQTPDAQRHNEKVCVETSA
jgi:hypothetical protein